METVAESVLMANIRFQVACARLLNISEWNQNSSWGGFFKAQLLNSKGKPLDNLAEKGQHIGLHYSNTAEWQDQHDFYFAIESIESNYNKEEDISSFSVRLRPCLEPGSPAFQQGQFFQHTETINLVLLRNGITLHGCLIGRNEQDLPATPWQQLFHYLFSFQRLKISSL